MASRSGAQKTLGPFRLRFVDIAFGNSMKLSVQVILCQEQLAFADRMNVNALWRFRWAHYGMFRRPRRACSYGGTARGANRVGKMCIGGGAGAAWEPGACFEEYDQKET